MRRLAIVLIALALGAPDAHARGRAQEGQLAVCGGQHGSAALGAHATLTKR